ncbi:MAG: hypothetical protein Q4B67_09000 [Eubacteriales bacterium]|nr:hypothetical protein [Eubacteriales bacterium]
MVKKLLKSIGFLACLIAVLLGLNSVFKLKYGDGIYSVEKFYEQDKDSVDVLILGSSHAFENINTGVLWDEYGMSSYIMGGSLQNMWNTYFYLREALKTQTPKVIVLEGYGLVLPEEDVFDSTIIKNTFGLKWSRNKVDAIKASVPRERWAEFFLSYVQYHNRYKELAKEDFLPDQGYNYYENWKGFVCNMETVSFERPDVSGLTKRGLIPEKTENYYRMVLELAKAEGIPVMVVIAPYAGITDDEQEKYLTAAMVAAEYDVPFLNCNTLYDEIGIDFDSDIGDRDHLNLRGNVKFTKFLGSYLKGSFDIPDHRGDMAYGSWEKNADYIRQMIYDKELSELTRREEITAKLSNKNLEVFVSADGDCSAYDASTAELLNELGISFNGQNGIWYLKDGATIWSSENVTDEYYWSTKRNDFLLKRAGVHNGIFIDNRQYRLTENGINIVVFDTLTGEIADCMAFNSYDGYNAVR